MILFNKQINIQETHKNESRHTNFIFILLINVLLFTLFYYLFTHILRLKCKQTHDRHVHYIYQMTRTLHLPNDTYFLFKVGAHNYFYHIFISKYSISVHFVEKKRKAYSHITNVNTEFEPTTSRVNKIVTNTCFHHLYNNIYYKHKQNHVETLSRVPCK